MSEFPFRGRLAVLGTMHRKEQAIAPVLEEMLGLRVEVARGLDTDRFGTFTREVPRPGTQLATAVRVVLEQHGAAHVESDMRAHVNPTRLQAIERAARDLVRLALSGCPHCRRPGFDVVERREGLPCAECGMPTRRVRMEIVGCTGCGFREERAPATGQVPASPGECDFCNP